MALDVVRALLPYWAPVRDHDGHTLPLHVAAPFWRVVGSLFAAAGRRDLVPALVPLSSTGDRAVPVDTIVRAPISSWV